MKNVPKLVLVFIILSTTTLFAQNDSSGLGRNSNYNRMYDVKTTTEINGKVTAFEKVPSKKGMSSGVHILVQSGSLTTPVHIGPKWFLDKQAVQIKLGDTVVVKGSKITFEGKQVVIAREISKNGKVLKLRNENGVPIWAGKE